MIQTKQETNSTIGELVRKAEQDFISGFTQTSKYVNESLYEDINKIEAYVASKHTSGETDSLGRDKPFYNIVTAARNIWFRATDIDRKNLLIKATKSRDLIASFLATIHLQDWMRRENWGQFLNNWGRVLATYNSAVVKFVEVGGKLHSMVIPWTRIIVDQVNFADNPKIEILEFTPAELRRHKGYDKDLVDKLLGALEARKTAGGQKKDNKNDYIRLYEVHGELPLSYLTGEDDDDDKFAQQMHVISFVESKEKGKFDDFTLISGKEARDPYMLTALMPEADGSVSLSGSVKNLFEAQWMMNHTVKSIKDQLDLASKLIFQTSDGNFVGQNALFAIESGDILIHKPNEPLTQLANTSHDIAALLSVGKEWQALGQEITSTPEAARGITPPSGIAMGTVQLVTGQGLSLFETMTENKGLDIERMLREHIIPFLKKKMDTSEEIAATLEAHDLARVDKAYISFKAIENINQKAIRAVLAGGIPEQPDLQGEMANVQSQLSNMGNQRFFKPSDIKDKTWKEVFKDLEWEVEVNITNEAKDTQTAMTTLSSVFQTIANPASAAVLQTPEGKLVFNKILEISGGVSPVELSNLNSELPINPAGVNPAASKVVPITGGQ